ncbi:hypothetical protein [Seonamhaeicola maritimus]|uniref:hypothetical protein n=1 Tax=Seonamhaeicola maritimus TaxID=2591822 RepID=UPI00249495CE|nr:hypothetical protein [Seonamhaeicola maritimus]
MKQVSRYINELQSLSSDSIFSIAQIEWWLLKHEGDYHKAKHINDSKYLYEIEGRIVRLPDSFGNPTNEEKFIDVYKRLNDLTQLHRNESYFKQEMAIYHNLKDKPEKVKQWLEKNERFGADTYVTFLIDYLDYDINDEEYHLKVFFLNNEELDVYVNREDFKYTLEFLQKFNELYW